MKNYIGAGLFALGLGIGGVCGWLTNHEKERARADKEIDEVINFYYRKYEKPKEAPKEEPKQTEEQEEQEAEEDRGEAEKVAMTNREKPDISDFKARTSAENDTKYSESFMTENKSKPEVGYIISEAEFDEHPTGYDSIELYYFKDGFVSEKDGTLVNDVYVTLGPNFKKKFGNKDVDEVFVRNDRLRSDFNILRHLGFYEDWRDTLPSRVTIE